MRIVPPILVLVGLTGPASAQEGKGIDVTDRIEKLGNPLAKRFPDGTKLHSARHISALQAFDGKLYLGHGDWALNSGPTEIWCYDLHRREFVNQGRIEDEAVDHFRVIGGRLTAPGTDPSEDWTRGNFYRLEDGHWVKHRTLSGVVHTLDIVGVDKALFALTTRLAQQQPCLMVSSDDGKTWKVHELPADVTVPPDVRIQQRLLVLDGTVYVPGIARSGGVTVHRFNGVGFEACAGEMLPGMEKPVRAPGGGSWSRVAMEKPAIFKGKVVYLGSLVQSIKESDKPWRSEKMSELYVAAPAGRNEFRAERSLGGDRVTDFVVDDRFCTVVGFRWNDKDDPSQGAVNTVSASADLKTWSPLFTFRADTFASALAVVDGDFYLGLGGSHELSTSSTGMILKLGKEKLR